METRQVTDRGGTGTGRDHTRKLNNAKARRYLKKTDCREYCGRKPGTRFMFSSEAGNIKGNNVSYN